MKQKNTLYHIYLIGHADPVIIHCADYKYLDDFCYIFDADNDVIGQFKIDHIVGITKNVMPSIIKIDVDQNSQ